MGYRHLISIHIFQLFMCHSEPVKCVSYTQALNNQHVDSLLTPECTHRSFKVIKKQSNQNNTQLGTVSNNTQLNDSGVKNMSADDSTSVTIKNNQLNDHATGIPNSDVVGKTNISNGMSQNNTTQNGVTNNSNMPDGKSETGISSKFEYIMCFMGIESYCSEYSKDKHIEVKKNDDKTNKGYEVEQSDVVIVPVESKNCFEYGKPGVVPSDWIKPEEFGWIVVNEFGVNRFTSSKPANMAYPQNLLLDKLECNAASYEIVLKLGSDSIGGLVFRTSTDKEMVVVLNSLTKTITLSKNQNGGYQVLYEKSHQGINSQFLHKLGIIDSGYKGEVQVLLDGQVVMNVPRLFFETSGGFGLHMEKGNVSFSDASIEPL